MSQESPFQVVSQPDVSILAQIECARKRLLVVAPGLTEEVARAVAAKWRELGPDAVKVVLDPDPENCRLGYGDLSALRLLHKTAAELGASILEQGGIRIGIVVTDETTTIFAPTPRLMESGGEPGERLNAIRFDLPATSDAGEQSPPIDPEALDLKAVPLSSRKVEEAAQNLADNPPLKFDVTQKITVFNTLFEFVELELNGLSLNRKKVKIPSELLGLAGDQEDRALLSSTCNLIEADSALTGKDLMLARLKIDEDYLTSLAHYGKVILRSGKDAFLAKIEELKSRVSAHKEKVKNSLQNEIDQKRARLYKGLLPAVLANPPKSWVKAYPTERHREVVQQKLWEELEEAFGKVDALVGSMEVKVLFKGVTYEMLSDPDFLQVAGEKLPTLAELHREFSAVEVKQGSLFHG